MVKVFFKDLSGLDKKNYSPAPVLNLSSGSFPLAEISPSMSTWRLSKMKAPPPAPPIVLYTS